MALFVPRIGADDPDATAALYRAAVHADLFDGSFYFHECFLCPPDNTSTAPIRIEVELYAITDQYFNSVQTHFAGEICKHDLAALKLHAKEGVRKRLINDAYVFNIAGSVRRLAAASQALAAASASALASAMEGRPAAVTS